ncbi:NADH-quinone oxidoreductase subunit A [Sphingomonas edaphi]|uniref:NADH-quinone oxidoreductase subunit A n=1 Tax=Sphingomonas edaphi TaxID=2315689 RepID=A0A418Q1S7_9SPHN|nr:NADH-quinone oxidoreductase subunit A [Sphingomonas edaphi]RIX31773.1 NADH-quinone oxidoreductase subunit A [Sphingomonas edaphi]
MASVAAGYLPILLFLAVALALSGAFVLLPMLVSRLAGTHKPDPEKLSEYECGFPAFEDSRAQFDVRFYLVAILFIVFDLEAAFLFPWAVSLVGTGWAGWGAMMIFLAELGLGLAYAWKKGALEWE